MNSPVLLLRSERRFYRGGHFLRQRLYRRLESRNHLTVSSYQKLFEVPLNLSREFWIRLRRGKVLVQWCFRIPNDANLRKHVEFDAEVFLAEVGDLGIAA